MDRGDAMTRVSMRWTWEKAVCQSDLKPTTKHVLLTLATYAGRQGEAVFPSVMQLVADTGLGESTVREHLKKAKASGWLETQPRHDGSGRQTSNLYHLAVPAGEGPGAGGSPSGQLEGEGPGAGGGTHRELDPHYVEQTTGTDQGKKKRARKKKRTQVPDDFRPTADHLAYALQHELDVEDERERFVLYHQKEGTLAASWNASFSLWLRNAVKYRARDRERAAEANAGSGEGQGGFWR